MRDSDNVGEMEMVHVCVYVSPLYWLSNILMLLIVLIFTIFSFHI